MIAGADAAYRTCGWTPERRGDVLALLERVWGRPTPPEELEWWLERSPSGPGLVRLAETETGSLAGVAAMGFARLEVGGEQVRAAVPLHLATHPEHRGRGVFARLERENEEEAAGEAPIALIFPNEASRRILVGRLGWRDLRGPRIWAAPWPLPGRAAAVQEVERFGPDAEGLWKRSSRGDGLVRDAAYLNWRFADAPRPYRLLEARRDGELRGLAVAGSLDRGGRRLGFLAELVAAEGAGAEARALVRRCVRAAPGRPFLAAGPARVLAPLGFCPTPRRLRVLGKPLRPGAGLPERLDLSLGDGDAF